MSGPSGYGTACEDETGFFIRSEAGSKACGTACNPLEQTGACCSSRDFRYRNLCFDDMSPANCARISGRYWGDDTTCLDDEDDCVNLRGRTIRLCYELTTPNPNFDWDITECTDMADCIDQAIASGNATGAYETMGPCMFYCPSDTAAPRYGEVGCCYHNTLGEPLGCSVTSGSPPLIDFGLDPADCPPFAGTTGVSLGANVNCQTAFGDCPYCPFVAGVPQSPEYWVSGEDATLTGACWTIGTTTCAQKKRAECDGDALSFDQVDEDCEAVYPGACELPCGQCIDGMPQYLCDVLDGTWQGQSTSC